MDSSSRPAFARGLWTSAFGKPGNRESYGAEEGWPGLDLLHGVLTQLNIGRPGGDKWIVYASDDNMADLVSHMPEEDRTRYNNYGHHRIEPAFVDRIFILYQPSGLNAARQHIDPKIITTVKVVDFSIDSTNGAMVRVRDENFGDEQIVTYIPKRLFKYQVFVSVPPRLMLRWDAHEAGGQAHRSLSFALLLKTRNKSSFYSKNNTYIESPNKFRELYPNVNGTTKFSF